MIIDEELIKKYLEITKAKIDYWKQYTNLEFDEFGRTKELTLSKSRKWSYEEIYNYFSGENDLDNIQESFLEVFNEYLKKNGYEIKVLIPVAIEGYWGSKSQAYRKIADSFTKEVVTRIKTFNRGLYQFKNSISSFKEIHLDSFLFNEIEVKSKHGKHTWNLSKLLGHVNDLWLKNNREYREADPKARKQLRKNNLFYDYYFLLNQQPNKEFRITVNPLDFLIVSGSRNNTAEELNPTSFKSCLANNFRIKNNELEVMRSIPVVPSELTDILSFTNNFAILYITNNKTLEYKGFNWEGFSKNCLVYLDKGNIKLNAFYPISTQFPLESSVISDFNKEKNNDVNITLKDMRYLDELNINDKERISEVFEAIRVNEGEFKYSQFIGCY